MRRLEAAAVITLALFAASFLSGFWSAQDPQCSQVFTGLLMLHIMAIGSAAAAVVLTGWARAAATYALLFLLLIYVMVVNSALYGGGEIRAALAAC